MLNFWRWGVLLAGLPLLAVVAGIVVWRKRQD
jgi:LPXTG-motif cell wall-anchored protein